MEWSVRLGSINIGHAFAASESRTMADFLSSPYCRGVVQRVDLLPSLDFIRAGDEPTTLSISVTGLRKHEELRELGSFVHFLGALPTSLGPSCTALSLLNIDFDSLEELAALCDGLASPLCSLTHIDLDFTIDSTEDSQVEQGGSTTQHFKKKETTTQLTAQDRLIKNALLNNTSLQTVSLFSGSAHPETLYPALTRSPCPIKELQIHLQGDHTLNHVHRILTGLARNTIAITSLHIRGGDWSSLSTSFKDSGMQLATMPQTNTSLSTLKLHLLYLPGQVIEMLFTSLEKNLYLTHLSLEGCEGPEWPNASSVLDSLRINGLISSLDLTYTPLSQSQVAIKAQLARNKENLKQLKVLKSRGSTQVKPTTVRLFLCGLPFSGKTTLSMSLIDWNTTLSSKKSSRSLVKWNSTNNALSSLTQCLLCARNSNMPERTRGIKVSTLENESIKVSLWDMAGQAEYYAFHDHMFPNLSNDSTPSLFLFVWNPIQMVEETGEEIRNGKGEIMMKTLDMFKNEFKYWLRFIASKTLKSLKFRPKLLVVVTRADLVEINIKSWFKNTFNQCKKDFEEYIQFDMEGVFEVDARDACDVKGLAVTIFNCASLVLDSMPLVYQACEEARRVLAKVVPTQPLAPLITKQQFSFICKKHLGIDTHEMEEAVALSLNDSGDIIYFKSLELVVVDTQWFCHQIMGDLLCFGDNCHRYQQQGFFTLEFLEGLLESKINSKTQGSRSKFNRHGSAKATSLPKIEGKALVKLLIGLRLACQRDDRQENSDIFIPASLTAISRQHGLPSLYLKDDQGTLTYMGRRLKCKNSYCTFFTPGIFPLLQVTFNNIFYGVEIILEEDIIAFSHHGIKVLIEFCKHEGQDYFIDVMVHSHLDLDETITWVYEEVLNNVEKVCAEPKGIQGVELMHEVMRPRCVKETVCMEKKRNAAVPMEKLREALNYQLERNGLDCLGSVFHQWQTTHDTDCVVNLLGTEETLKVVEAYKRQFIIDVEDVLGINIEKEACSPQGPVFRSTPSGIERAFIYNGVQEACKGIQEVRKDIREMHKHIKKIGEDMRYQCEFLLPKLSQRMQELSTLFKEREMANLPRMFVVTKNNEGGMRKIVGAMIPGLKNVHLELLCEYQSQPHLVEEQPGINFATLDDGLLKQGLPYISMFLKVAGLVVKVGAHIAAGLGDAVPDFRRVLAAVVNAPDVVKVGANIAAGLSDAVPDFRHVLAAVVNAPESSTNTPSQGSSTSHTSRLHFQGGQRWLANVLSRHNCCSNERIHEVFQLSRVQYGDSHVGWLCDTHSTEGKLFPT